MTSPTVDRPRFWRRLSPQALIVGVAITNLISTGIFVFASTSAANEAGKTARAENCANVIEAFDAYTAALAAVSGADKDTVADFRAAYEPHLEECS